MKNMKKLIIMMMCAMMVFTAVPEMNSNAATKTYTIKCIEATRTCKTNRGTIIISGNKLTVKPVFYVNGQKRNKSITKPIASNCKYYVASTKTNYEQISKKSFMQYIADGYTEVNNQHNFYGILQNGQITKMYLRMAYLH